MIYTHRCAQHGVFEDTRPVARYKDAPPCPTCGEPCQQTFADLDTANEIIHKEKDWALHANRADPRIDKDTAYHDMAFSNKRTGERERVYFRKKDSDLHKRELIASAYRRAGQRVGAGDVQLTNG